MSSSGFIFVFIFSAKDFILPPAGTLATLILIIVLTLSGCRNPIDTSALNSLAKSDIDMMADTSLEEMNRLMAELLVKLYKRNPDQLAKGQGVSVEQRHSQLFDRTGRLIFKELDNKQGTDALDLAFDPDFAGDRVFALMVGLVGMVRSTYNWQSEQFLFDSLDEQALFKSARNIEILAWRLSHSVNAEGDLLLLSNSRPGEVENLSYERIFGKMIAIQDLLAFVTAGRWERGMRSVVKQAVFLPMGL